MARACPLSLGVFWQEDFDDMHGADCGDIGYMDDDIFPGFVEDPALLL